jgi:hypothetical protein
LWQSPPLGFCATSVAIPLPPGWRRSQSALSALGFSLVPRTPRTEGLGYRFCHTAFTAPTWRIIPSSSNCEVHLNGCRGNSKPCCREMTRRAAYRASDEQKGDTRKAGYLSRRLGGHACSVQPPACIPMIDRALSKGRVADVLRKLHWRLRVSTIFSSFYCSGTAFWRPCKEVPQAWRTSDARRPAPRETAAFCLPDFPQPFPPANTWRDKSL